MKCTLISKIDAYEVLYCCTNKKLKLITLSSRLKTNTPVHINDFGTWIEKLVLDYSLRPCTWPSLCT